MTDLWPVVPRLLADNRYMVLATADPTGTPWVTPVYFGTEWPGELLWVSSPDSRHSTNIVGRPEVAITVFDSHAPIGGAEAIYLEAGAHLVAYADLARPLVALNSRLPAHQQLDVRDVSASSPLRVYRADVMRWFVLVRGGDDRFDNVVDARVEVHPPVETIAIVERVRRWPSSGSAVSRGASAR